MLQLDGNGPMCNLRFVDYIDFMGGSKNELDCLSTC